MRVKDVMTRDPVCVRDTDRLTSAAKEMRDRGIGDVLVVDKDGGLCGIMTDRDIVVRAIAAGDDPNVASVADVCTRNVASLSPEAKVKEAVLCMCDHAVRRLPVVDGGRLVGIVSIGDLAKVRDSESALGQISASPANL